MYDYEFVRVELGWFTRRPKADYHQIIREHVERGWRLVQIFAPSTSGYGQASYFELIFEKAR